MLIATVLALPVSTTHTIVSGIVTFGLVEFGSSPFDDTTLIIIAVACIISPILGCAIAAFLYFLIEKLILNKEGDWVILKIISIFFFLISSLSFLFLCLFLLKNLFEK